MTQPLPIYPATQPAHRTEESVSPILRKGFRLFFLGAAVFAALSVVIWILWLNGVTAVSGANPVAWHPREMVFGFTAAVIAGFLLTAVSNWTGRETVVGSPLLALFVLWALGRVVTVLAGIIPPLVVAVVDGAFLPALALSILRPIAGSRNRRNYVMVVIVLALSAANIATHLEGSGVTPTLGREATLAGVDIVTVLILLITGRIVPAFTRNATGKTSVRSIPILDRSAVALMTILAVASFLGLGGELLALLCLAAGFCAAVRTRHWGFRAALEDPMLWVLHAGHACVVLGLILRAISAVSPAFPSSLALHATTVGGIGLLTLGMMARVSLGHTGRPIRASRLLRAAFWLLLLAVPARAILPILHPPSVLVFWSATGALWSAAFVLFVVDMAPKLTRPRVDGRPG